jgi:hypothetical protein
MVVVIMIVIVIVVVIVVMIVPRLDIDATVRGTLAHVASGAEGGDPDCGSEDCSDPAFECLGHLPSSSNRRAIAGTASLGRPASRDGNGTLERSCQDDGPHDLPGPERRG